MAVWEVVSRAFVFLQWKDQYILILMEERDQREEQYMNEYEWELNRERICRLKDYVVYLLMLEIDMVAIISQPAFSQITTPRPFNISMPLALAGQTLK